MKLDFYSILEVKPDADGAEIRKAYRKLVLEFHPDRNFGNSHAEETFKKIQQAYQTLSNVDQRADYDRARSAFNAYGFPPKSEKTNEAPRPTPRKKPRTQWSQRARADWELDKDLVDNEFEARDVLVGVILGAISYLWICPFYVQDLGETSILWYFLWAVGPVLGGCVLFYKIGQGLAATAGAALNSLPNSLSLWEALLRFLPLGFSVLGAWLAVRSADLLNIDLPTHGLVAATICSGLAAAFGAAFGRAFTLVAVRPTAKVAGVLIGMFFGSVSGGVVSFFVVSITITPGLDAAFFSALSLGTLAAVVGGALGSAAGSLRS
jgi:hypothetical protein